MNGVPKRQLAAVSVAVLTGSVLGFFVAFNAVFSDAFGATAYAGLALYVVGAYGVVGLALGLVWPNRRWRWGLWLAAPALLILVLYTFREPQAVLWHLIVYALALIGASLGAASGAGIRHARGSGREGSE